MSKQPSILILDTYYPEFLKVAPLIGGLSYEQELAALMRRCFGTYDCYSRGLAALGWETEDFIVNHLKLQLTHPRELKQQKDVLFYQDLNTAKAGVGVGPLIAGQISCAWPGDEVIRRFDILFTSFPHYLDRIEALGVRAIYLPLAFDPIVYERLALIGGKRDVRRTHDVVFVGGLGAQWAAKDLLDYVVGQLSVFDRFHIFGYGNPNYMPVWGLEMYQLYAGSKIVLNRHHPSANGYSNNLRMFEATGMGALLLTEHSPNIYDFFVPNKECITYANAGDCVDQIRYYLDPAHEEERAAIALAGQRRTLTQHTYAHRLPTVDRELRAMLELKKELPV